MSHQNQPKTIEDYKDVVKILKLKIIKQSKRAQQLELKVKNYEEQINSVTIRGEDWQISSRAMAEMENEASLKKEQREIQMNTLKGKVEVMNIFIKGIKKIGITPESVFRIADFNYKTYVESDYFREILSKMKLSLSPKEISCLIFIFDEACSGFITREDYSNSLHAYKVGVENSNHLYVQECIFKLSQMMHQDKVNLIKFYEEMEGKSKSKVGTTNKKMIDLNIFEEQIKKYYSGKVSEREIIAAFNAIDLESEGYLEKSNFLYCITSYINKLLSGQDSLSRKSQAEWNNGKSRMTEPFVDTVKTSPKKGEKAVDNFNSGSKLAVIGENSAHTPNFGALSKLQSDYNTNIYSIYEQLLMFDFTHRLTLKTFKKMLTTSNPSLPAEAITDLYREIDTQMKGSIYFPDLINFYLLNSQDSEMIYRMLGKYFLMNDLTAEKFWYMFGFGADSQISKTKFLETMRKTFDSKEEKLWEHIWGKFDKGRGSCNVGGIIRTLEKYECE